MPNAEQPAETVSVQVETNTPSDAAKVLRRKVYDAVDAAYDEACKRYRRKLQGEFTDATIAEELGCSVQLVEKIREEFFGPANRAEPAEDIKALQIAVAHLERETDQLENMAKGLGVQARENRQKIATVKDDLKKLCQEFGWAH